MTSSAKALIRFLLLIGAARALANCAQTEIQRLPDGTLSYKSSKNVHAVIKEYHDDGTPARDIDITGDASTVIDSQAALVGAAANAVISGMKAAKP